MSVASAPGKIVLWGEYAVLAGAPAGVLALNNLAEVRFTPSSDTNWHFSSQGFVSEPTACDENTLPESPQSNFIRLILSHWGCTSLAQCSTPLDISIDSTAFFAHQQKLGLGSSAAVCVATYRALCEITNRSPLLHEALVIHRTWQGGKGSGLDVASVWHGGFVHFQDGDATPASLPTELHWQVIWSGKSAKTSDHISHFEQWRQGSATAPLRDLASLSTQLCEQPPNLGVLRDYCDGLRALDDAAQLNIFTHEHARLGKLASAAHVLYKPCGAGGGDIGIAFSDDPTALAKFKRSAGADGFLPLDLEMASHGVAFYDG